MRPCTDVVDGVPLTRFRLGHTYDIDASLGTYLMAVGCAHVVVDPRHAPISPQDLASELREAVHRAAASADRVHQQRRPTRPRKNLTKRKER